LRLVSPQDDTQRGSQVCFAHGEMGYPVMQALIARGVIGDFRAGDKSHTDVAMKKSHPAGGNDKSHLAGASDKSHPDRTLDILRFGFTPLYLRFVDAWDAAEHLRAVLASGEWQRPEFNRRQAVT